MLAITCLALLMPVWVVSPVLPAAFVARVAPSGLLAGGVLVPAGSMLPLPDFMPPGASPTATPTPTPLPTVIFVPASPDAPFDTVVVVPNCDSAFVAPSAMLEAVCLVLVCTVAKVLLILPGKPCALVMRESSALPACSKPALAPCAVTCAVLSMVSRPPVRSPSRTLPAWDDLKSTPTRSDPGAFFLESPARAVRISPSVVLRPVAVRDTSRDIACSKRDCVGDCAFSAAPTAPTAELPSMRIACPPPVLRPSPEPCVS